MAPIHDHVLSLVGGTPLVRLNRVTEGVKPEILAKVESFNPGGSIKDRIGIAMIEAAEESGDLQPGGTVVEATAGNTGVGLALVSAIKGYRCIFVLPDKMSDDKVRLLQAYGAEIVRTPSNVSHDSPEHYSQVAARIARETPGGWLADQFENPVNRQAHYRSTAPEIWKDTEGKIDAFVGGMGTTGTVMGVARYLKERNPGIRVVVADPPGSIFGGGEEGSYLVEGIGNDHHPGIYDADLVDDFVYVPDARAFRLARRLAREEGLLVGGSAGTALGAALEIAREMEEGQRIVVMFADTGRNYLGKVFNDAWIREQGLEDEE